jgi:pumilio RNA-binding family
MAADIDAFSSVPQVGTWFKKMPALLEEEGHEEPGAAKADMPTIDDDVVALGNPRKMLVDAELAAYVEEQLESANSTRCAGIIAWMQPAAVDLALSSNGTRVIQKALEVTRVESQVALSNCLHGRVRQLLDSHHGNHVLQKTIVMMPPHAWKFILHELSFFSGGWAGVVKHRFGCRVVERLLEHCESAELTAPIVAAVVAEIDSLAKHPFANYVVQHILEYVPAHRSQVVHALVQVGVPHLAQHRVASHIIERAFEHGSAENHRVLGEAILSIPNAIVEMGCSRYGSFTVRRMLEALQDPLYSWALQELAMAIPSLRSSKHGRHIAARTSAALNRYR